MRTAMKLEEVLMFGVDQYIFNLCRMGVLAFFLVPDPGFTGYLINARIRSDQLFTIRDWRLYVVCLAQISQ